jgi:hypothetical protein
MIMQNPLDQDVSLTNQIETLRRENERWKKVNSELFSLAMKNLEEGKE